MLAVKVFPHLFAFFGITLLLLRCFPGRRKLSLVSCLAGFAAGAGATSLLILNVPGKFPFELIRSALGASFFLFWGVSVAALYRSSERTLPGAPAVSRPFVPLLAGVLGGALAGAVAACRLAGTDNLLIPAVLLLAGALVMAAGAWWSEQWLPPAITVSRPGLFAAVVSLLLFSASSLLRLDLFSPLSMKVMKGTHDFVHQFMESVLIPDHLFVRAKIWGYIGLLFSKDVGFWGGMIIWFTPVLLVALAIRLELLPSVAHIRQGAQRRKVLAAAIRDRRLRLVVPALALFFLGCAAYRSSFPVVEYWDPKPLPVVASASGEIFIPRKGEVELEDGKLHKYLFKKGTQEVRFFVMLSPASGKLTVDLDACAICKPDGYGQAEGSVICYYCKTLIPLETVGLPGGCNPIPVKFVEKEDGAHIDAVTLVNTWTGTVQSATKKEAAK